jgi:molecular chaperone GrpE
LLATFLPTIGVQFNDYKEMSKKEDIKEEVINTVEETQQVEESQEVAEESVKEIPTAEELILAEKDKFLRLFAEFENYKKRTTRERV